MTSQKAIEILSSQNISSYSYNDVISTRDMAIDALNKLEGIENIKAELIARMWNWRSKNSTLIDKLAMESIIIDVFKEQLGENT